MSGLKKDNRYKAGIAFASITALILLSVYFIFNTKNIENKESNNVSDLVKILEKGFDENFSDDMIEKIDHVESLYKHRIFTIRNDILKALSEDSGLAEEMLSTFVVLKDFEKKNAFDNLINDIHKETKLELTKRQVSLVGKANRIKLLQVNEAGLMMVVNLSKVLEKDPEEVAYILYKANFLEN